MLPCVVIGCFTRALHTVAIEHPDGRTILRLCPLHAKEVEEVIQAMEGERILRRSMPELFSGSRPRWAS